MSNRKVNRLIGLVDDPFAELYLIQLNKMKTTGIVFKVRYQIDLFSGSFFILKMGKKLKLKGLKIF
jgi:hypothetical protein